MSAESMSPHELAQATREALWADDKASQAMGMQVQSVGPGTATLTMRVRADMLNAHAVCHGGLLAMLADSALGFACNAYNEVTLTSGFDVNLISSAREGDFLTAVAVEISKAGRTGVYDIQVHNQRGEPVLAFRGRSYTMRGRAVVEGLPMGKRRT